MMFLAALKTIGTKRRLLAAAFLIVFLAEFGSHAVICAGHSGFETASVSSSDRGHEDPCQTLVLCSDGRQKDRQSKASGHDPAQHNALFDSSRMSVVTKFDDRRSSFDYSPAEAIFRPPDPPFHPPQIS